MFFPPAPVALAKYNTIAKVHTTIADYTGTGLLLIINRLNANVPKKMQSQFYLKQTVSGAKQYTINVENNKTIWKMIHILQHYSMLPQKTPHSTIL